MDFTGTDMDTDNNTAVDTLIVIMISFCLIRVLVCLLSIFINRDMHCCVARKCMMRIIILRIKHYMLIVLYLW